MKNKPTDQNSRLMSNFVMNFTNVALTHQEIFSTIYLQIFFVLLLRAGFVAVQLGSIPAQNIYKMILFNIIDIAISVVCFGVVGCVFAFGDDTLGIIGHKPWFSFEKIDVHSVAIGFSACIIANGIITTCLGGRMHFAGFVVINIVLSMVIHPMLMHWTWNKDGWMQTKELFRSKLTLTDNFGCLAIHIYAGTVALIGGLFFGGRLILLEEISEMSIGLDSPANSIVGYIFIIIGLISFIPPGIKPELTLINNLMALGSGVISVSVLQFLICKEAVTYWTMLKCMQGAIAAIITVAGGVHLYSSLTVLLMALCGSGIFYVVQISLHNNFLIEDYCNVVTLHLICGVLGLAFSPLIIMPNVKSLVLFLWHIICILATFAFLAATTTILFFLLLITATLRNDSEEINHERSLVLSNKSKNRKCLQRLFHGDLNIPQIEPGTRKNVGLDTVVSKEVQNTQNIRKTTEKHASLVMEVCVNKQSVCVESTANLTDWYMKGQYSYTFDKEFNNYYRWNHTYKLVNDEYSRFISTK